MARLQKDTVSYFPHDSDACTMDTLTVLQSRFGNDGYAFWFKLLEKLASTDGHYVDCRNATKWQLLLAKTGVDEITGVEIMKLLVEMHAIDKELWETKVIWCQHLVNNVADVYKNRRRALPLKPINTNHNPLTTTKRVINPNTASRNKLTTDESTQSKVKESKVKESKLKESKLAKHKHGEYKNVLLTDKEQSDLITKFGEVGFNERVEEMSLAIGSKGYKYKSHYLAILQWEKRKQKDGKNKQNTRTDDKEYSLPDDLRH